LEEFYTFVANFVSLLVDNLEKEGNKESNKKYFKGLIFNTIPRATLPTGDNLFPLVPTSANVISDKKKINNKLINST
jgi:hypothetical protein